ncbi:MAG TPA: aminotransferase class V-fold PLP-dependent enzyme [Gaiellaceae bacterium]|jgi:selenocysteine lyase/cysteine desulfurase|nr:aminotransferase class V-fold PLP-dependent enzyme [Gaiellaceae bacterium]
MALDRRDFLVRSGAALAAAAVLGPEAVAGQEETEARAPLSWHAVRSQFRLRRDRVHLGAFLLASHPAPVRRAIERHRRALDADPVGYLHRQWTLREALVLQAAARYTGGHAADIALTDSTTMGLALLYNGIHVRPGEELLTSTHDFFVTHDALRLRAERAGAKLKRVELYERGEAASADEIVRRIAAAVTPRTRVVALTWVHSSTGVKLPIRRIAAALARLNRGRGQAERILFCVDGVHGFGIESTRLPDLGCDFFAAGCHKWLFGPRGTGIVWGRPSAWPHVTHTIPSFTDTGTPGSAMTPGGFHSFEHRWALAEAFAFHRRIGKARVAARTHTLNRQLKAGLAAMRHVTVHTPRSDSLSAGLVCFEVRGLSPQQVVDRLLARGIVATVTPYTPSYARLAPSILNRPAEIQRAVRAIRALG